MREIKFRAWDSQRLRYSKDNSSLATFFTDCEHHSLMQFTGVIIEKGTEVYDGDIIKNGLDGIWLILPVDSGSFNMFCLEGDHNGSTFLISALNRNSTLLGNKFENPELIEKQSINKRNWEEDYKLNNGEYFHICKKCDQKFIGHKRRSVCKNCSKIGYI